MHKFILAMRSRSFLSPSLCKCRFANVAFGKVTCMAQAISVSSNVPYLVGQLPTSGLRSTLQVRHLASLSSTHQLSRSGALFARASSSTHLSLSSFKQQLPRHFSSDKKNIVSFNLSDIGEGISEVVIKEWFIKEGDRVNQFDSICEVQSDKASVTITSRYDGIVHKIYYNVEDTAKVGKPLVDFQLDEAVATADNRTTVDVVDDPVTDKFEDDYSGSSQILTTPAVRRLAMEHKIHLKDVVGTGKDGRILKEDVLNYIHMSSQKSASVAENKGNEGSPTPQSALPVAKIQPKATLAAALPADRVESIKGITKSMFKTMTASLSVPHFGLSEEVDMTALVKLRPEMKKIAQEKNVALSYMPFLIKAASLALTEYPILNASVDKDGEKIIYKGSHNIGVAMDTKQGLLVPNVKGVNQLSILEIANELNRLQELGQKGQLAPSDLTGGTFTLSNIGSIGGVFGIPVLMPSEVAIGAIGRMRQVPRFVDETSDKIERAFVLQVLWSADHRIIDGATMTRFSNRWRSYLESPFKIFL